MWKAAFTGRSEKGDKDRDTASVSGRPEARRKKSSRSTRGDVDDAASVMSGSSRRHWSSRHEGSSRYGDEEDRDRMKDSSYYSGPSSVYGSAATHASPASSAYATAPTSRVSAPNSRPLTASALRMLPDDDNDEWEDDEKTVRSERRTSTRKRSPSDERDKRRKSSGKSGEKERERKRSSSRERKEKKRSSTSEKVKDKSRRSEPELVADASRAIPAMGSFEQFPGQYGGGVMGQHADYTMSGALPNAAPQSQFPGQDYTAPYEQAAPPHIGIARADSYGHAAEYYLDEGQSVAHQPGNRASTPNMLANPDQHLMAASAVPNPVQDTGNGTAAEFYNDASSYSAPVTPAKPSTKPGKQPPFSASKPSKSSSKPSKPSRSSSASAVAAGLAGVAGASALGKMGKSGKTSHQYSQSEQTTPASYQQGASTQSDYPPSMNSQQRPPRHVSDGNVYYVQPAQNGAAMETSHATSSAYGASYAASSGHGPSYENTYGTGNLSGKTTNQSNAGLYAAGATAAGAAAYGIHQHHQHGRTDSNMAIAGDFGGNGQGPPRSPRPSGNGGYYPPSNNGNAGGMMQQGRFHEHKGPMTKLKDGLLNLISTPEDVAKMEMYTEYIGVCKHCFDPRTSAWDAPRVHHYHKHKDSFESLRRRASRDKLRRQGSYERVDKESRYYASDSSRRRREERHSGMGLAGAGLAAVGTGLAANALFNNRKDFDDTYSVKSGHRESSAVRRRSRSSSRERRRRSQYGTTRPGQDEFANVTIRKKDGTVEHRRVVRSRSGDRKSGFGVGTAAAAGAALGAAGLAASARRRSRSSSRDRTRRSTRVSPGRSEYSRHERNDQRKSEEGGGGIFGNFFSPPRKQRRNSREHHKKRGGFFTFSNGSSSSSNSELAFGGSFVSRNGSKTSLSRKSSGRSTRGRPQRKSSDQHLAATLAGIGATAAALGAAKAGHRISKRTSRPELGARRQVKQHVVGDHRHGSPESSGEDGWEDELHSDDASNADGLAFGDYGGKRLSGRQSLESVASASSASGLGAWGWRWGGKDKKRRSRRSTSGELPYPNSEYGSSIGPIGAGIAAGTVGAAAGSVFDGSRPYADRPVYLDDAGRALPSVDARSSTSGASAQPMQYVDPKPVSEAGTPRYQTDLGIFETPSRAPSMPGAFEPDDAPIYRPGPGIVQHPQPLSPARPAFTQPGADTGYTATAGAYDDRPLPRRTQSSPVQSSWGQDAALIGAGVLGAGAIIAGSAMSSGRKPKDSSSNVRFGLTEEQERKESRYSRRKEQEVDEERRRSDRTRALKEEAERAAKASREEEVLRAREAENQARAQARLDLQREQEHKEAEEARSRAEQRAREERERQWEIERLEKEAVDRQAAAAAATADFERQRQAREEAERQQAEVEKQNRERDQALRQQYQLVEDARREDEERRQWEAERFAREYQELTKTTPARDYTAPSSARDRRGSDATRKEPSGWGTVAMGAAAAAGVGAMIAGREEKKRRQSGKIDSTDDTPVSRRAPRSSVDWNVDAHAAERDAAKQAELDRQVREQYGHASSGNVEMKNGYAATEIKPGSDEHGEPIMDDDIFDPDFFKRSQHTPAERVRREKLARKAADKVVADRTRAYSPGSRPKESYADFFADEVKDVLAKKPGEKERSIQPDSDVQVYHIEEDGVQPAFTLRNDLGGKSKHAPYGVPQLNVIAPTPPPGSRTGSVKGSVPNSPLNKAVDAGAERDESPESSKDSGKSDRSRSISWGEDKTHIYDVQTPESSQEKDRDSYITSPDIRGVGAGVAGAAGAAVAGAVLHDIVVEEGEKKTAYKDDDFSTTSSSKKSKKDKKKAKKSSKSHNDDADSSFLDNLSSKDKAADSFPEVPAERGTEASYRENEFSRTRKDNDRDRQQQQQQQQQQKGTVDDLPETLPHPIYQQPFFDSVSDFSNFQAVASPGTEGTPPVRGFVERETKKPTPAEEKRPHIPGGFDDDEEDYSPQPAATEAQSRAGAKSESSKDTEAEASAWQPPLSKKDKKKREKEAKRASSGTFETSEPSTTVSQADAVEQPAWEPSRSAKDKKKLDSGSKRASDSTFDVEPVAPIAEPEVAAWQAPLSAKEKKKRDKEAKRASGSHDAEPSTPVAEQEADVDAWEPPLSVKERKKREKAAKKAGINSANSEEPTPVAESPKAVEEDTDEYFQSSSSKKDKKKKAKQFDEGLQRIASTTSAVSMPSWSGDTVVSDVTAKPPSPELTKAEQRESAKGVKSSSGFSFADVTDTILASGGVTAAATALHDSTEDSTSGSTGKKDKKRKKKAKLGEPGYEYLPDEPSGMPGGWDSPERKSSQDETPLESAREVAVDPFDVQSSNEAATTIVPAPPEPTPVQESDPWEESFEPTSSKKSKKKSKRSSVAFDNIPQVSSPLRSEIAWDDYIGANGTNGDRKANSEAARSDPITVIERKSSDDGKGSRKSSKDDDFYDAGQRISHSPRGISPEDARSVASSADADRESRRKSRRDEARRGSDYYDQPDYAYEVQSVAASDPADEDGRKRHKSRSKREDDDALSMSSSRRRSRHAEDDDDIRSVTSSRSRRDKEGSPVVNKEKKGIFGSLFGRRSTEDATRDSKKDEDDEDRHRRKKKHRDSEYGGDDDDTRSVKSESHHRRHRSSDGKHDDDSREHRRRSTHDDDDKYSESGSRHHRRRKTDENGESLSRHQSRESRDDKSERPKHHRRRTDEDKHDTRDQSFLGSRVEELPPLPASRPGSPDQAVERMEGRPLEAGFGTGLVNVAAAGLASGVVVSALSSNKKKNKNKSKRKEQRESSRERVTDQTARSEPLPSVAAHSFPLSYAPAPSEARGMVEHEESVSQTPAPVLEKPSRPVSIGRPGSSTTVPLRLPGHAPATPGAKERTKSISSPIAIAPAGSALSSPATPGSAKSRQGRPHSSDLKSGIMPLYLVERSRPIQEVEDSLPSLPSSKPSSRASSAHASDEYESAREELSAVNSPERSRSRSLTLDTTAANERRGDDDILDSQQTTPKASEWPQTAIPWSFPSSVEKREKQEPQFYTWEDFAQDERMHEQQDESISIARDEASRARSKSPSKAKALAAAAMLGTAAVYAAHQVKDRAPEPTVEAARDEPFSSSAAHSYPLPYVSEPATETKVQGESRDTESPRELEQAFESTVSSKKSKKESKKGKKLQDREEDAPTEQTTATQSQPDSSGAVVEDRNEADAASRDLAAQDTAWPSVAAHTFGVVPSINFTEPSPEKDEVVQDHHPKIKQDADLGNFASSAAHSMPVYELPKSSHNASHDARPTTAHRLPELKSEPAPLVVELRNVQVDHNATVDVEPAPKLTRKQSKKDKKKSKKTSVFGDDDQPSQAESSAEQQVQADDPLTDVSGDVGNTAASRVNFGLSDFGAVAAGAASAWGLSQADAFRTSMEKVENGGSTDSSRELAGVEGTVQAADSAQVDETDNFEPLASKNRSKKDKRKANKASAWDDEAESQDQPKDAAETERPFEPTAEPVQVPEAETLDESVEKPIENPASQDMAEPEVDNWSVPPSSSKKRSKKDKKKAASWAEPEIETMSPVVPDEQPSADLQASAVGLEKADPVDGGPAETTSAAPEARSSLPVVETTAAIFADVPSKKSKKGKKQKKPVSWDALDQEPVAEPDASGVSPPDAGHEAVSTQMEAHDVVADASLKQEPITEDSEHGNVSSIVEDIDPVSEDVKPAVAQEMQIMDMASAPDDAASSLRPTSGGGEQAQSAEGEIPLTAFEKQSKREKRKKKATSWDASPEEATSSGEGKESVQPSEQSPAEGESAKEGESSKVGESTEESVLETGLAIAAGAAAATALVGISREAVDIATEGTTTSNNIIENPEAEDSLPTPVSKKKSKKDKKKTAAFEWDEPTSSRDGQPAESSTPDFQEPQIDVPLTVEPVENEKPVLSRKQSKKDKKKQKSLSWDLSEEPKASDETSVEPAVVDAKVTDTASVPASEITHAADRGAVGDASQPTATPDDSFHDAEDFFDAPADADPWHDAAETTVKDETSTEATVETSERATSADQDQRQASVEESSANVTNDTTQDPVLTSDDSAQQSNLVDDVFGIASGTGELNTTLSNDPGDREEVMADRGMEFEPERASEDMDAFGDPTPRDPAEWSLGTSKKSGKKGKKGRKSVSKVPAKVEALIPSSSESRQESVLTADMGVDEQPKEIESALSEQNTTAGHSAETAPLADTKDAASELETSSIRTTELSEVAQDTEQFNLASVVQPPDETEPVKNNDVQEDLPVVLQPGMDSADSSAPAAEDQITPSNDDMDAHSWAPTSKKKKGKKGKKVQEAPSANDSTERTVPDETSAPMDNIVEAPLTAAVEAVASASTDESQRDASTEASFAIDEQSVPAAVTDEPENLTWAPSSKKDKREAKKAAKSGTQTPQPVDESDAQAQKQSAQISDKNASQETKEVGSGQKTDVEDFQGLDEPKEEPASIEEEFAWASSSNSKKDKKKAKKASKSGAQTPQLVEENKPQEQSSQVSNQNVVHEGEENADDRMINGQDSLRLDELKEDTAAIELDTPSSQEIESSLQDDNIIAATTKEQPEDVKGTENPSAESVTEPSVVKQGATSVEAEVFEPSPTLPADKVSSDATQPMGIPDQQTNELDSPEAEPAWAMSSKKSKKKKKAGKSVSEAPSVATKGSEDETVEQTLEKASDSSRVTALAVGGAAVAASLLAKSHIDGMPSSEDPAPASTMVDDSTFSPSEKQRTPVDASSISPPETQELATAVNPEAELETSTSLPNGAGDAPASNDTPQDTVPSQASAADPQDEWVPSSGKKKKGKKNKKSTQVDWTSAVTSDEVHDVQQENNGPIPDATANEVAHDTEDVSNAELRGTDAILFPKAETSRDGTGFEASSARRASEEVQSSEDAVTTEKVEEQEGQSSGDNVQTFPNDQEAEPSKEAASETTADASGVPPVEPLADEPDEWSATTSSKKKKGKKGKKLSMANSVAEPEPESRPPDAEFPEEHFENAAAKEPATEAVAEDTWGTTSSKKKKGKKGKTVTEWAEEPSDAPTADAPTADPEMFRDQAGTTTLQDDSPVVTAPATPAEPSVSNGDDITSFSTSKKKKGKKSKAATDRTAEPSDAQVVDHEPSTDRGDTTVTTDEPRIGDAPLTPAEPSTANEDEFANFTTSKKKKGKKSKKLDSFLDTIPSADADIDPAEQLTSAQETQASVESPSALVAEHGNIEQGTASTAEAEEVLRTSEIDPIRLQDADTVVQPGDDEVPGHGLIHDQAPAEKTSEDVKAADNESTILERVAASGEDHIKAEAAINETPANVMTQDADVASSSEAPEKADDGTVAPTAESVQADDQLWPTQTSKKSKKKTKRDKLASIDMAEGAGNVETQVDPTLQDSARTELTEKLTAKAEETSGDPASSNDPVANAPLVTEADDVFSSFSGKKKGKKAKKARQSLLDEISEPPAVTPDFEISQDTNTEAPETNAESSVAQQQSDEQPDGTEALPSTLHPTTDEIPHLETTAHEASIPDVAALSTPLPGSPAAETPAPDAPTEDPSALQGGKKKKGNGKKGRQSILDEASGNSDTIVDETIDMAMIGNDSAPQSTASTSQEPTEAESEDMRKPPNKGKKAKKNKKLQQVAALNAQTEVAGQDSDSLWKEDNTSTSEAQPTSVEVSTDEPSIPIKLEEEESAHRTQEPTLQPAAETPLPITEDGAGLETTRDAQNMVAIQEPQLEDCSQIPLPIEQPDASPAMDSMSAAETAPGSKSQGEVEQDVGSLEPAFIASKSKKSKKESKKAKKSAVDSWEDADVGKPSDKAENSLGNAGAVVGAAAIVAAIAATSQSTANDAMSEEVDDWGSYSTKKSKKDKKKARKSGVEVAEVSQDTESAPASVEALDNPHPADYAPLASEMPATTSAEVDTESKVTSPKPQLLGNIDIQSAAIEQSAQEPKTHSIEDEDRQEARVLEAARVPAVEPARAMGDSDIDFTATVAAGLADSGFDPDMVINDPSFQRRASPTGVAEADPDEVLVAPSTSKKKRKGKRDLHEAEVASNEIPTDSIAEQRSTSNVDAIVNKTLEGTGFDPALLNKALAASREHPPVEAEDEFAFTTTKRKKNKKGKGKVPTLEDETATPVDTATAGEPALPVAPAGDMDTPQMADQEPATTDTAPVPTTTAESSEHAWLVQDEMDVDAMDKAYRAYKKNKRQQKKLKAANQSAGLSDNPDGSALEGTGRSVILSEVEDVSRQPVEDLRQIEQSRSGSDEASTKAPETARSSTSKGIVETVFPGLERIKRRMPASAGEQNSTGDHVPTTETGSRGLMHTSEVSQHLPVDVPRTPPPRGGERGISAASHEASWSFAALQEESRALNTSPTRESSHQGVRDSGYETAKRSSQQTDRSSGEVPAIVRTSSSRDSLRQRRSLEPLRVSTPTSPEWNLHTPKQKTEYGTARATSKHERMPSANTPLEPTKAASMSSPAFEQPSPSQTVSATRDHSSSLPSKTSPATDSEGHRERSALSPTSPRGPLDAIPEERAHQQHSRKRSKARAEVGGPEHIKAIRRTETPQAIRAQEQALSPSVRHGSSGTARSIGSPLSTSDEVFNRLPWPAVDQDNDTVNLDRSLSRQPPRTSMTPDFGSGSVLSDRSNTSANAFKSPQELRSYSRNSDRSSTPSLRRTSLSGDLRAVSRRGGSDLGSLTGSAVGARASPQTIPFEPPPTPPLEHDELINGSASRAVDMNDDVFQGFGDAQQSQVSPTRPPSVRKRQSMHINELESRLDYLVAENRALQEAQQASEGSRGIDGGSLQDALEARDLQLQAKDAEINQIKAMLQPLQEEVARLTELSNGLSEANKNLADDANGRYGTLQAEHAEAHHQWQATARELESMRNEHGRITSGMRDIVEAEIATALADKNAEILRLREQLDIAAEQIRAFQVQIQGSKASDWLVQRDEDYFDGSCQKLCQHVQQWVLRFSKMSDNRVCRLSTELNDDKIEARLDNAVLDGSDVDRLLGDRVRRRDVFMSVVMTMVWEYVFTRYLFGMDREQRQKLKALEKLLSDVGPPRAVAHWRATTLTLLSKRPSFDAQCALDTEAVAHEIFGVLCMLLPPPAASKEQLQTSLQKVLRVAVDLAIEMRTQRAEYIMLPPLQPEYDTNGDLVRKVYFNASLMNERSGLFSSNEELAAKHSVVKIVLFPLVVKKGDDVGEGDDEIVVCPAQVLVNNEEKRDKKIVRVMSGAMEIDGPIRSRQSNRSLMSEAPGSTGF